MCDSPELQELQELLQTVQDVLPVVGISEEVITFLKCRGGCDRMDEPLLFCDNVDEDGNCCWECCHSEEEAQRHRTCDITGYCVQFCICNHCEEKCIHEPHHHCYVVGCDVAISSLSNICDEHYYSLMNSECSQCGDTENTDRAIYFNTRMQIYVLCPGCVSLWQSNTFYNVEKYNHC
jgi:hypothetical protein